LELDTIFPTCAKVEQHGSGSQRVWDQFGTFQNERGQHDFKRFWNLTPFFQHAPKWKSRDQVPTNDFKKRLELDPIFSNMGQSGKAEARFQAHLGRVWPFQNEKE